MHFGLESYVPYVEYAVFIGCVLLSIFWRPIVGIFYLLPLIPLQTLRYRLNDLPLGGSVMGVMLVAVALGLLRRGQPIFPKSPWTKWVCIYFLFSFVSLVLGSFYLGRPLPLPGDERFGVWQDFILLPVMLLLVAAVKPTRKEIVAIVIVMCLATLALDHNFWDAVSGRDFSTYSDDIREASSMGYAGSNGLAAFEAQVVGLLLALAAFEKRFLWRIGYYGLASFSAICLMYSLSRGGYIALLAGCLFLGLFKQRKLLIFLALFAFTWTSLVPGAVQQRVQMSYDQQTEALDNSAETRLTLWEGALDVFRTSPIIGTGFDTYAYMELTKRTDGVQGYYEDTHNIFVKVLVETGILGLLIFLWFLLKTFRVGFHLFRRAKDPFFASLGLGLCAWMVCAVAANCFGDRWTYPQVSGFMWVLCGLVSQALLIENTEPAVDPVAAVDPQPSFI
jgi:putative inorganic carbon (hco3(-)) transporter